MIFYIFPFLFSLTATSRVKRVSPQPSVMQHQRSMYGEMGMNDDMIYGPGPSSSSNERITPHSRHRADEG